MCAQSAHYLYKKLPLDTVKVLLLFAVQAVLNLQGEKNSKFQVGLETATFWTLSLTP